MSPQPAPLLSCHWNVGAGVPLAAALKVAAAGAVTAWLAGCWVMVAATGAGLTVSSAAVLVTLLEELLITTRRKRLLCATSTASKVNVAAVAPASSV